LRYDRQDPSGDQIELGADCKRNDGFEH
jgi:hypothetical protein